MLVDRRRGFKGMLGAIRNNRIFAGHGEERVIIFVLSVHIIINLQKMNGYGWLTQSALMPKKSRSIKCQDQSSLFGLKAVISREKEKMSGGNRRDLHQVKRTHKRNTGVEQRANKDQREIVKSNKVHDSAKMLQIKKKVYNSLEASKQNVGKLLVNFTAKSVLENEEEYERVRDQFYSGRLDDNQRQREQIEGDNIEQRDIRERLAWERQELGKLKGDVDEREKVQQVFDKRTHGEEKTALEAVRKEFTEQEKRLEEVKQRREELQSQRIRKLKKINRLVESKADEEKQQQTQTMRQQKGQAQQASQKQ